MFGRKNKSFLTHLNRHNVIRLDIQRFLFDESHLDIFIDKVQEAVIRELEEEYGGYFVADQYGLPGVLGQIYSSGPMTPYSPESGRKKIV